MIFNSRPKEVEVYGRISTETYIRVDMCLLVFLIVHIYTEMVKGLLHSFPLSVFEDSINVLLCSNMYTTQN